MVCRTICCVPPFCLTKQLRVSGAPDLNSNSEVALFVWTLWVHDDNGWRGGVEVKLMVYSQRFP